MSRTRKRFAMHNHPAGSDSEKEDKKKWHRKYRRKVTITTTKLTKHNDSVHEGRNDFPLISEIVDPWQMGKDRSNK